MSARCEYSDEAVERLARALRDCLARPGSLGASKWLDDCGFAPADRRAVIVALHDLEAEVA